MTTELEMVGGLKGCTVAFRLKKMGNDIIAVEAKRKKNIFKNPDKGWVTVAHILNDGTITWMTNFDIRFFLREELKRLKTT